MKRYLASVLAIGLFALSISNVDAKPRRKSSGSGSDIKQWGIGVNLGEPIGMNTRFYFLEHFAGDLTLGYGFDEKAFIVQPSVLFHLKDIIDYKGDNFTFFPYFGAGFKTGITKYNSGVAAMRFPIGATWALSDGEFEVSLEFAPGVEFNPRNEFDATGGIGLRYYFF